MQEVQSFSKPESRNLYGIVIVFYFTIGIFASYIGNDSIYLYASVVHALAWYFTKHGERKSAKVLLMSFAISLFIGWIIEAIRYSDEFLKTGKFAMNEGKTLLYALSAALGIFFGGVMRIKT